MAAVAAALLLWPFPSPDFGPFEKTEGAENFLRTLWGVEAAALALSLTIIVFAVQAYRDSTRDRYGGSLFRFIRASYLQQGYEIGVLALLLNGAVLLGAGNGGPSGSAGLVATGVSLFSIALLPFLLGAALRTTHRDFLAAERRDRLTTAVADSVDRDVQIRLALAYLVGLAKSEPVDFSLLGRRSDGAAADTILAGRNGAVVDINLRRLIRLARAMSGVGRLTISTRLGDYVGESARVLVLPAGTGERRGRLARKVVNVREGRRRDETLSRYLDDLQEEAIAAIRAAGPATFEAIADAYVETLLEFPRSWKRYGQRYSDAAAKGIELFPVGPVDEIRHQFTMNLVQALQGDNQEVLLTAAYLPIRVSTRALPYLADGLLERMLGLLPVFLAAAWSHGGEGGRLLEERAQRYLVEFTYHQLTPLLESGEISGRERAAGYVRLVYAQMERMLKMTVEAGKIEALAGLDRAWGGLLRHWHLEMRDPSPYEVPHLEQAAAEARPGAAQQLQLARENARMLELREGLDDRLRVGRFGLALWAWRQTPPSWLQSFKHLAAEIGGIAQIARVTTQAIDAENRERVPWSDWILSSFDDEEFHAIDAGDAALQTFIAMMLRVLDPAEPVPPLEPAEWMARYIARARELLTKAVGDERNSDLPDVAALAERIRDALEQGARDWERQERQSTIDAPLIEERVSEFLDETEAAVKDSRLVPVLFGLAGALRELPERPEDPPVVRARPSRALFVEGGRMIGADMVAGDLGRQVAHLEREHLIEPLKVIEPEPAVTSDSGDVQEQFAERLRITIARMAAVGTSTFLVILLPIEWRVSQALGLPFLGAGVTPPEGWGLPEGASHNFAGVFAETPVFQLPEAQGEVVYVVDLARYAIAETWQPQIGRTVSLRPITEPEAVELAKRTPGREKLGEQEIALRYREQVMVTIDPCLRLPEDRDQQAVSALAVPQELFQR